MKLATACLFLFVTQVYSHGNILAAYGENGIETRGLGITMDFAARTGTGNAFQVDSPIIRAKEIAKGAKASECGRTTGAGKIDIQSLAAKVRSASAAEGYATVTEGKTLKMVMYQVNGDGAGPFTCQLSKSLDAKFNTELTVTQNVPGKKGNNKATQLSNNTIEVQIPMGVQCTDACIVRCMNPANAGPFGGCVPVVVTPANGAGNPVPGNPVAGNPVAGNPAAGTPAAGTPPPAMRKLRL
ncbi:hypothetical protein BKA69DRAFT_1172422 [Paraphysoderma sedebokerense]|nr:hypothetical protein BKA69DRAFT_1172422 [Paraphysoderma sedebokerense]